MVYDEKVKKLKSELKKSQEKTKSATEEVLPLHSDLTKHVFPWDLYVVSYVDVNTLLVIILPPNQSAFWGLSSTGIAAWNIGIELIF